MHQISLSLAVKAAGAAMLGGGPLFNAPLMSSLIPTKAKGDNYPTFTRASEATFTDYEGVVRTVNSGEPRFSGARRVENQCTVSEGFTSEWTSSLSTVTTGVTDPLGGTSAVRVKANSANGLFYQGIATPVGSLNRNSLWIRRTIGTGNIRIYTGSSSSSQSFTSTLTTNWQRIATDPVTVTAVGRIGVRVTIAGDEIEMAFVQAEDITGQANQAPAEYVAAGTGGQLGAESVVNGGFDTDSGWTKAAEWSISGGVASCDGTQAGSVNLSQAGVVTLGKRYILTYTISGAAGQQIQPFVGVGAAGTLRNADGTYSEILTASGDTTLYFQAKVGFAGSIDNVSVKEVLYYGANVDGVKYFSTKNGNTVASTVVTEGTGAAIGASDYNADATGPFGYVGEDAATNLLTYSEEFDNAAWNNLGLSAVNADVVVAPDGTTTAEEIVENTGLSRHIVYQGGGVTTGVVASYTVFAKKNTRDRVIIKADNAAGNSSAIFNLATGAVGNSNNCTTSMVAYPDGWYRCCIVYTPVSDGPQNHHVGLADSDTFDAAFESTYTGDGTSSIYIWGAQLEDGTFPTSYIKTEAATATRAADVLTFDDVGNIEDAAGTAVCEATRLNSGALSPQAYFVDRGGSGRILYSSNSDEASVYDGVEVSTSPQGADMYDGPQAIASSWGSSLTAYLNGAPDLSPGSYSGTMGSGDINIMSQNPAGTLRNVKIYNAEGKV